MTKNTKSRRSQGSRVANANPRSYSELLKQEKQSNTVTAVVTPAKAASIEAVPTSAGKRVDWQSEYHYIFADLRQLLFVSVALLALMIVLNILL